MHHGSADPETADEVVRQREALEELVGTEGWRIFVAHVRREWEGPGYRSRMAAALGLAGGTIEPTVIHRTSTELLRVIQWPTDQIAELKGVAE
jgi:hypothetical protein